MISLLIIDETDNVDYFLYKFNLSKNDKKRILFLKNFYLESISKKTFTKDNLFKILYLNGKQSLLDVLYYQMIKSKFNSKKIKELIYFFKDKPSPIFPITAKKLIDNYSLSEGKELGTKLKQIEERWIKNNFKINDNEINNIIKS